MKISENAVLEDLSFLAGPHPLTDLSVNDCDRLTDLSGLRDKPLTGLWARGAARRARRSGPRWPVYPACAPLQVTGASLAMAPPALTLPSVFQLVLVDHVPPGALTRLADLFPRLHVLNLWAAQQQYDLRRVVVPPTPVHVDFLAMRPVLGMERLPEGVQVFVGGKPLP